uniref:Glycosyltransferase family 1 protein n=1 Tax=Romanomermis culicivorax TaxID=13658 RepID=A0A915KWH5_ROMCU
MCDKLTIKSLLVTENHHTQLYSPILWPTIMRKHGRTLLIACLIFSGSQAIVRRACRRQKSRRVAFIDVHSDPDESEIGTVGAGGQNVYVRELAQSIMPDDWQVDIFTRRTGYGRPVVTHHPTGYRTVRLRAGPLAPVARDDLARYVDEFVENFILFQSNDSGLCANEPYYQVIHTHYWLSARAGIEIKRCFEGAVALVHTYHSFGRVKYEYMKEHGQKLPSIGRERLEVEKRILVEGDAIVATSPLEAMDIRAASQGDINARISVIPCGTNIAKQNSGQSATKYYPNEHVIPDIGGRFNDSIKIVLYVGRFEERKGIKQLICAFERARKFLSPGKDLRLVLVGGDPSEIEYSNIRKFSENSNVRQFSTLAGRVSHDRLPHYYASAHVTVIPSLYEPFGLVAIESMRMGTPVIASAVGGLPYIVDHGRNGLLVPANDTEALSRAIVAMLADEQRAKEMGLRENLETHIRMLKIIVMKKVDFVLSELREHILGNI